MSDGVHVRGHTDEGLERADSGGHGVHAWADGGAPSEWPPDIFAPRHAAAGGSPLHAGLAGVCRRLEKEVSNAGSDWADSTPLPARAVSWSGVNLFARECSFGSTASSAAGPAALARDDSRTSMTSYSEVDYDGRAPRWVAGEDAKLVAEACEAWSEVLKQVASSMSDLSLSQLFVVMEGELALANRLLRHNYALLDLQAAWMYLGAAVRGGEDCWVFASPLLCQRAAGAAEGDAEADALILEASCALLTQSFGRSDCQEGHVVVVHFPAQRHWGLRNADASHAAEPFSPEYWHDNGGKVVPALSSQRDAQGGAGLASLRVRGQVDSSVCWSVEKRKCRLLAGNSRQLHAEAAAFLQLIQDDGAPDRPASTGSSVGWDRIRVVQGRTECANSDDLNHGLEDLRPRLKCVERVCRVLSRELVHSSLLSVVSGPATPGGVASAVGMGSEGMWHDRRLLRWLTTRVYHPGPVALRAHADGVGGAWARAAPASSREHCGEMLWEALRKACATPKSAAQLSDQARILSFRLAHLRRTARAPCLETHACELRLHMYARATMMKCKVEGLLWCMRAWSRCLKRRSASSSSSPKAACQRRSSLFRHQPTLRTRSQAGTRRRQACSLRESRQSRKGFHRPLRLHKCRGRWN